MRDLYFFALFLFVSILFSCSSEKQFAKQHQNFKKKNIENVDESLVKAKTEVKIKDNDIISEKKEEVAVVENKSISLSTKNKLSDHFSPQYDNGSQETSSPPLKVLRFFEKLKKSNALGYTQKEDTKISTVLIFIIIAVAFFLILVLLGVDVIMAFIFTLLLTIIMLLLGL